MLSNLVNQIVSIADEEAIKAARDLREQREICPDCKVRPRARSLANGSLLTYCRQCRKERNQKAYQSTQGKKK